MSRTSSYPKEKFFSETIDVVDKIDCCGCEACANRCPMNAIEMKLNEEGFYYPFVNYEKCIKCGKCKEVCPSINNEKGEILIKGTQAFACYNKQDEIRRDSTSGGVFSLIAEYIIQKKQGVVYGARFDSDYCVYHARANSMDEIVAFRGSKYVQSRIHDVYKQVEIDLKSKRIVFFTGLPCQIEGLLCFLGLEYDNLYCMDMVCFGVGSPKIWNDYLEAFHDKENINQVVFRDKTTSWKNWRMKIVENNEEYYYTNRENLYINSFLKRINIRSSCFQCKYKGLIRKSDVTVGDCWGIGENNKDLNDDKGLSALLVHTDKGREIFENIKNKMNYLEYDVERLMEGNWAAIRPLKINEEREKFMTIMYENGVEVAMRQFCTSR